MAACLLVVAPAFAGDRATHLSATHYLARQAGLNERDATLVARADWSMDQNLSTTALPTVDPMGDAWIVNEYTNQAARVGEYQARGATYHALGNDPTEVRNHVEALRRAIPGPDAARGARLIAAGQYLHALQDVFFHQNHGKPYEPVWGHARLGEDADKVAFNYDAALLAFDESARVLAAIAAGEGVPSVNWERAYEARRKPYPASFGRQFDPELVKLASAISRSYGPDHKLDDDALRTNLANTWSAAGHPDSYDPFVQLGGSGNRTKLNYDTNPQLLSVKIGGGQIQSSGPGGVSFSAAAAERLPLDLDLEAVWVDEGRIVIAGKPSSKTHVFDAAEFLTAIRLACGHIDPFFSLVPANGASWWSEGNVAFDEFYRAHKDDSTAAPALEEAFDDAVGRVVVIRRKIEGGELATHHPALVSKLVFYPEWLRHTRFGKVLYEADVLLKVLSSGMPVEESGRILPAPSIPGYHSADERLAVERLLAKLQGLETEQPTGSRLWFDLADDRGPWPWLRDLPPTETASPNVGSPLGAVDDASRSRLIRSLQARLGDAGLVTGATEIDQESQSPGAVAVDGNALGLEGIWPHMFVHRHDFVTGKDLPGRELSEDEVAKDVNGRISDWAARYSELEALVNTLRAYVAAVKIADLNPQVCSSMVGVPLLPAEGLSVELPKTRPSILTSELILVRVAIKSNGGIETHVLYGNGGAVSGGVSFQVKSAPRSARFLPGATPATRIVTALARGQVPVSGSESASLLLDLHVAEADARPFEPVTEDDVIGSRGGGTPWGAEVKWLIAQMMASRIIGDLVIVPIVFFLFAQIGFIVERLKKHGER